MSKGRTAAKRGTIPSILDRFAGLDLIQDADDLCLRESRLAHRNSFSAGILTGGTKLCAALLAGMITPNYIRLFWRLQWHFPMLHNIFPPTFSAFRHTGRAVTENSITRQFAYERCKAAPSVSVRIGALTVLVGKGAACIGDLNRQYSQQSRGGGMLCYSTAAFVKAMFGMVDHWSACGAPPPG